MTETKTAPKESLYVNKDGALESLTRKQLLVVAKQKEVTVTSKMTKPEIAKAILANQKSAAVGLLAEGEY